jgi:hypothetical protein
MTPWKEFSGQSASEIARLMAGKIVVDPYGVLNHRACEIEGLNHFQIGNA